MNVTVDKWYDSIKDTHTYITKDNQVYNKIFCNIYSIAIEYEYQILKALCIQNKELMKKNILEIYNNFKNQIYNLDFENRNSKIIPTSKDLIILNVIKNKFCLIVNSHSHYCEENIDPNYKSKNN